MQEIVKFSEMNTKKAKRKQSTYSALTAALLKNKDLRATLASLILIFGICCVGLSLFSDALLSIGGFDEIISDKLSDYAMSVLLFLVDFTAFAFALFPLALGIYAYALHVTQSADADTGIIFFYYQKRSKYLFAVRLAYYALFVLVLLFALSYFVAHFGIMLAKSFLSDADIVRATVLLLLTLACIISLLAVALARICDLFIIVSLSLDSCCSIREMLRASSVLVKESRKRIFINRLSAILPLLVAIFSAGLLAPFVLPRAIVSRAFLENDIINEYKIKNNI